MKIVQNTRSWQHNPTFAIEVTVVGYSVHEHCMRYEGDMENFQKSVGNKASG